jgi:tetratricopeptide (TPR) repeat protein
LSPYGWDWNWPDRIDHPGLNLAWARVLVELKQFNQAESLLQERAQKNTADPSSWLLLGAVRLEMNRPQDAAQAWQRFLKETAQQPKRNAERDQALMGLAQISLDAKDDAQAVQWLSQVSDGNNLLRANVMRASILARQGQVNEGRAVIANMPVRTQKQEIARTLAEAQYLRQNKLWQEVYDLLSLAANKFEDDDELDYELATAAEKIGRVDQMEALLRGIIERSPDFHQAYNALGYSLADRNVQLNEARRLIVKALEMAPDDPFITDSLGWVEFRLGRLKEAKEILARAYEAKADAEIAAHLGEVLWAAGERENAMTVWRQGLQLAPDNETLQDTLRRLGVKP